MIDPFAVFGLPRRPWFDEDELKERFHRLTAEHHPDVSRGNESIFPEINAAHSTLRDPALRIFCLLALEGFANGGSGAQIPPDLGQLFMETGSVRHKLENFLRKEENTVSPIAKAMLAGERMVVMDECESQIGILSRKKQDLLDEIREIDVNWPVEALSCAARLAEIAQSLAFFRKWLAQLREGYSRLAV